MKGKLKRILSAALACVMLLALLPATAMAAETSHDTGTFVIRYYISGTGTENLYTESNKYSIANQPDSSWNHGSTDSYNGKNLSLSISPGYAILTQYNDTVKANSGLTLCQTKGGTKLANGHADVVSWLKQYATGGVPTGLSERENVSTIVSQINAQYAAANEYYQRNNKNITLPTDLSAANYNGFQFVDATWCTEGERTIHVSVQLYKFDEFMLEYDANGGAGTAPTDLTKYRAGDSKTLDSYTALGEEGDNIVCIGWSTSNAYSALTPANVAVPEETIVNSVTFGDDNIKVYAVWAKDVNNNNTPDYEETKYSITYASGTSDTVEGIPATVGNILSGTTQTVSTVTPTRTGYTFAGWTETVPADATAVTITTDGSGNQTFTMPARNVTFTAQWRENTYNVTYTFQSGTTGAALPDSVTSQEPADSTTAKYNDIVTQPSLGNNSLEETSGDKVYVWTFGGWYTDQDMNTQASFPITVTGDVNLYGKWTRAEKDKVTITVVYRDENGDSLTNSGGTTSQEIYVGGSYSYTAGTQPVPYTLTDASGNNYCYVGPATGSSLTGSNVQENTTVTLIYALDNWKDSPSGDSETDGDGIPDQYQAKVTFRIVNGTWDGNSDTADKVNVVTLYEKGEDGIWTQITPAPVIAVPTGMTPVTGYDPTSGTWAPVPSVDDNGKVAVTATITYVYTFNAKNQYTVAVNYLDEATKTQLRAPDVSTSVEYGNSYDVSKLVSDTLTTEAGKHYVKTGSDSLTGENVTGNVTVNVYYAVDNWNAETDEITDGDGIPDKYQVLINYVSANEKQGTVSPAQEVLTIYADDEKTTYAENGTVTATGSTAQANGGYKFVNWTDGGAQVSTAAKYVPSIADAKGGETYTFTANFARIYYPPIVTPDPTIKVKGLNTVDHVAYIIGVGNDKVNPLGTITRGEIAAIYFRLMTDEFRSANWSTENRFKDVPDNAWYTMAILTLDKAGIITDSDDGNFRPNDPITRAELAVMAAQFCTVTGNIPKTSFKDVPADYWAAKEIALIEYAGWIEGYDGRFYPDDNLNRAEAVTIVNRMLQRGAEKENMLPDMVTFADNTPDKWYYEAIQEAANSHDYTRTTKLLTGETFRGEKWTALLEATDWAAMEKAWIEANS